MRTSMLAPLSTALLAVTLLSGCATPGPTTLSNTQILDPSEEDGVGGSFMESSDIQTVASRMCPALLALPQVSGGTGVTRIALAPVRNSTSYVIDKDLLMKRLRLELNRYGNGRVSFFAQGSNTSAVRDQVLAERQSADLDATLDEVAGFLALAPELSRGEVSVGLVPAKNVNFVNMNADSYVSLLRGRLAERLRGSVLFYTETKDATIPESVDYLLTGEFIADSMKKEGVFTAFDDAAVTAQGNSTSGSSVRVSIGADGSVDVSSDKHETAGGSILQEGFRVEDYKDLPNVTKYLNVMLVERSTSLAVQERMFTLQRKVESGLGNADYILSGELSALSKAGEGLRSDYVLITFQLIDPVSNMILWEDGYETKRSTSVGVVYR